MNDELMKAARDLIQEYKTDENPYPTVGIGSTTIFVYEDLTLSQTVYETYQGFPVVYVGGIGPLTAAPAR